MGKKCEDDAEPFISHTIRRAIYLTGLSRTTIYLLAKRGELEIRKNGRQSLVPHDALRKFITELPCRDALTSRVGRKRRI